MYVNRHTDICIDWCTVLHVYLFYRVIVEMLQQLNQASEATDEKLSEVPVCNDSNSTDDAHDANEPDDAGEMQVGSEVHIDTVKSAGKDDDDGDVCDGDNVDASADFVGERCLSRIDSMSATLGQRDSEANQDHELSHDPAECEETESSDQQAGTEMDQNTSVKSDSAQSCLLYTS